MANRWCVVPQCTNTTKNAPEKLFVSVPTKPEVRKKWLELCCRDPNGIQANTNVFMCEDHFNMENDIKNYMQYKMGFSKKLYLADGVIPSKFDCQPDRKRRLKDPSRSERLRSRAAFVKRNKVDYVEVFEKEMDAIEENIITKNVPEDLSEIEKIDSEKPSFNRLEACRTCLGLINVDNSPFFKIEADDMELSADSCRHKLLSIVPEMALNITPKSMLCAECHCSLQALFEFKKKCLKTETILAQYIQTKLDLDIKNLDLKEVSAFNAADIEISENKSFEEVFVDEFTVKEEVELYDTAIVKQEVDDFSLENVEVAQPKNAVPGFLADVNISEEETAEASFQDVVVKKEVESYDPVITNVKDEVVNLCKSKKYAKVGTNKPLRIHTGKPSKIYKKTHRCEICNCRFVKKNQLVIHLRTHTGEKPYRCDTCNRCFSHKSNLTIHLRTHTGEKPYCCDTCHRRFAHKSHLNSHLGMHTGKHPYVCTVCGKGFPTNTKLGLHNRIHTGEKPYLCSICDKRFTLKYNFTVHMRNHTGEHQYVCTFCDKGYPTNSWLKVHMRTHTGERPYRCELCDRSFKRKSHLSAHLRVHGGRSAAAARDPLQD